jgi:hypothetical protein
MAGNFVFGPDDFRDAWNLTLPKHVDKIINMLGRTHPLLDDVSKMAAEKYKMPVAETSIGGKRIVYRVQGRINKNTRAVAPRAVIPTIESEDIDVFEVDCKKVQTPYAIWDDEVRVNSANELANIVKVKQDAASADYAQYVATQLYKHGNSNLEMNGLKYMISDDPYSQVAGKDLWIYNHKRSGTPGDRNEWWRNRVCDWGATNLVMTDELDQKKVFDGLAAMKMTIQATYKNAITKFYLGPKLFWMYYQYCVSHRIALATDQQQKDMGFMVTAFDGIPVIKDHYCPAWRGYAITKSSIDFLYLGKSVYPFTKPSDDQEVTRYGFSVWQNWVCTMPRLNGVFIANSGVASTLPSGCNLSDFSTFHDYDYPDWSNITDKIGGDIAISLTGTPEYTGYSGSGVIVDYTNVNTDADPS